MKCFADQDELTIGEFIRRFAMHILPHRFVRIRHFGILSFHGRSKKIPELQKLQDYCPCVELIVERPSPPVDVCLKCNSKNLNTTILLKQKNRSP